MVTLCTALVLLGVGSAPIGLEVHAASAQVTPLDEDQQDAPGLGDITGSPEAGPDPEDAGDRGGFAQLGLAIVLLGAVGFITSRVVLAARAGTSNETSSTGA